MGSAAPSQLKHDRSAGCTSVSARNARPSCAASGAEAGGAKRATDLGESFGDELTAAEVRYLIRHEFAETADDVLSRRSKLYLRVGADAAAALARFMENGDGRVAAAE